MTLAELVVSLRGAGIELWLDGDRLRFTAPPGALTPSLRAEIGTHRGELLTLLRDSASATEIARADRTKPVPLSFGQERFWFLDRLEPGSTTYTVPAILRIDGPLAEESLERALTATIDRHEALRTSFRTVSGVLSQVVAAPGSFQLARLDLRDTREPNAEFSRLADALLAQPFELATGPLVRATLARVSSDCWKLVLAIHHAVVDGWSIGILVRELAEQYAAASAGRPPRFGAATLQYADFAAFERETAAKDATGDLAYWRAKLDGMSGELALPVDKPRNARASRRAGVFAFAFSEKVTASVRTLGGRQESTSFVVFLAAFQTLLARYTGADDVCVGIPVSGRTRKSLDFVVGCFVNTVIIRNAVTAGMTFESLVRSTRGAVAEAQEHQELSFDRVVEALRAARGGTSSLFNVMFTMAPSLPEIRLGECTVALEPYAPLTAKFDLSLTIEADGRRGAFEYDADLLDESTVARLAEHFDRLLASALLHPERELSDHELATLEDRAPLAVREERHAGAAPRGLHESFESAVRERGESLALKDGDREWSYRELDGRAEAVAEALLERGVKPGELVGVCMRRGAEAIAALLGVLKVGAAYVPLDPEYPRDRLAYMIHDCRARVVLTDGHVPALAEAALDVHALPTARGARADVEPQPSAAAYVIYTSGTTGRPKGVVVEHRSAASYVRSFVERLGLGPGDRVLQFASLSFDVSVEEIFATLSSGATLVLRTDAMSDGVEGLVRGCDEAAVTVLDLPTAYWHELAVALEAGGTRLPERIRAVVIGGERAKRETLTRWRRVSRPGLPLFNMYGPTEATIAATWADLASCDESRELPIGEPLAGVSAYVVDAWGGLAPRGVAGELLLGGECLARGYLNQPSLTAERFVPNPFGTGRLYRTGDKVRRRGDGQLEYLGRLDEQVKVRGFRIELGEIETALRECAGVKDAAVTVRDEESGGPRLVAYVVGDGPLDALKEKLRARLPGHMVPSAYVSLAALPLSPTGKIDRRSLPAPEACAREYAAPRTDLERTLCLLFEELLGVQRVGIHDDFFDLGGHSLLATRLAARIRTDLGQEISLRAIFDAPTPAGLAAAASRQGAATEPIAAVGRDDALPVSFSQARLLFLAELEPGSTVYNVPVALRLCGALDAQALGASLDALVRRHEALRTTFASVDGEWRQIIAAAREPVLEIRSPSNEAAVEALIATEAGRAFDLAHGPLFRATLVRESATDHVLLLTMHHLVSDGWSMGVLVRELVGSYRALSAGHPGPFAPLAIQFADYAAWQRRRARDGALERGLAYWTEQLSGAPPSLELPTDRPRSMGAAHAAACHTHVAGPELLARLRSAGGARGATLFMTLLAAFDVLLVRHTGQSEVVVGTPVANRTRVETEALIGFFVNTLALKATVSEKTTFAELLAQVRERALGAYAHQDVPFERVVEALRVPRALGRTPLFGAMFVLQNAPLGPLEVPGLTIHPISSPPSSAMFDLTLTAEESDEGLGLRWEYDADLFDAGTVRALAARFVVLLDAVCGNPDVNVNRVDLLTAEERRGILATSSRANEHGTAASGLHESFESVVRERGESLALKDGDREWSYRELDGRAEAVAEALLERGVKPGELVGVCMRRGAEAIAALLGVLKVGAAYVPLDPEYPRDRLAYMIHDCRARIVLTDGHVPALAEAALDVRALPAARGARADVEPQPSAAAYVIYTSGTTGRPKGVVVEHRSAASYVRSFVERLGLGPGDRVLQFASLSFDVSVEEIFATLSSGATLVLRTDAMSDGVEGLVRGCDEAAVTVLDLPTAYWHELAVALEAGGTRLPERIRAVVIGGERAKRETLTRWRRVSRPGLPLFNMYGPTEATIAATWADLASCDESRELPIGEPLAGVSAYVVDAWGGLAPRGVAGELLLGGECLARGYLNQPSLTAERFVPNPFGTGRLYRTGDKVRRRGDGQLEYLGRLDEQVKVRGFRIELGEIETALRECAGVKDAAVTVRDEESGGPRLVAYVVGNGPLDALKEKLRARLPGHMVPSAYVSLAALPLSPTGKIDRRSLPAPEACAREYAAPRTDLERTLCLLFEELLGVQRVGIHDDFFDLGGHSLLATRLVSAIGARMQARLSLRQVFETPTVADLAAQAVPALQNQAPIPRLRRRGSP